MRKYARWPGCRPTLSESRYRSPSKAATRANLAAGGVEQQRMIIDSPTGHTCIRGGTGIFELAWPVSQCAVSRAFSVVGRPACVVGRARGDLRNQLCHGDSALVWPGVGHVGTSARVATNTEAAARSDDLVAFAPGARSAGPGLLGTPGLRESHRVPAGCSLYPGRE
jgi:hypothetical protein